ncbi:uncharacterized protein DUF3714 [Mariniflexile fucanivorans]|uniref:Uncharacterized protein DUF3714 n=1 Tax=Mariniflexile fucanivorans TaxID=264023 RepID=A0A4V2QD69_9FLAO|nr:conjugative transposon protein TraM [Mariniflexile fucanivorans]TCL62477.1 uncharacterized protein DUF3714 [Mariniflexile fucanivorans]
MISNKDSNLAHEVQKKKKLMEVKQTKEKKRMMIAYIVIGSIALLLVLIAVFNFSKSDEKQSADFETPSTSDREKYDSKIEALEAKSKKIKNENLLDIFSTEEKDTIKKNVSTEEEEALRKNLDALGSPEASSNNQKAASKNTNNDVYGDYSMWEKEGEKTSKNTSKTYSNKETYNKELSYEERLAKARASKIHSENDVVEVSTIETRVAIFRDQFKLPGELVELVLTKEFRYNGTIFKKGTLLYADMNINKSRVLFNITNIAHQPLNLEVRDIRDGRIGMYSSRAGELWDKYESEAMNESTDKVTDGITGTTGGKILSGSINAISKFFQNKRLKNDDKILLLNDQELIMHILEK